MDALAWPFGNGCLSTRCLLRAGAQALPGWPDCQGDCRLKLDIARGADHQYLLIQNDASARSFCRGQAMMGQLCYQKRVHLGSHCMLDFEPGTLQTSVQ